LQTGVVNFTHRIAVHRLAASKCKAEVGDVLNGVVTSIKAYGAFVDIGDGATGLLHISNITHDRLTSVEQVLKVRAVSLDMRCMPLCGRRNAACCCSLGFVSLACVPCLSCLSRSLAAALQ
jgi:hypothetical protein